MQQASGQHKHAINLVWFKRDLRLTDHQPLLSAIEEGKPILLLYVFEPSLLADAHYSEKHWRFVWQSLEDINAHLAPFNASITVMQGEVIDILEQVTADFELEGIFSHEEVGLAITFARDKAVSAWCEQKEISWNEYQHGAVIRGATNRVTWEKTWSKYMKAPIDSPDFSKAALVAYEPPKGFNVVPEPSWTKKKRGVQTGGSTLAWRTLHDFYDERGKDYAFNISKPSKSRTHCSRLSPYLAWGNISLREVYQTVLANWSRPGWRRSLSAFSSRLHWHCHFIQKFESESDMEFRAVNRGYADFPYRQDENVANDLAAWETGRTGYPLVDACMRCLNATGYINFRMRSMLVSFLCHHLNIDWQRGVKHLARCFLDFEPGIHYAQFQMQAGITGTNTIRIYNPTKQATEHDPDGQFIKQWVPELRDLPVPLLFEPWLITPLEAEMYNLHLGEEGSYPQPIIDLDDAAKAARERLWGWRKRAEVKEEKVRILGRHVRPDSRKRD